MHHDTLLRNTVKATQGSAHSVHTLNLKVVLKTTAKASQGGAHSVHTLDCAKVYTLVGSKFVH